MKTVAPLAFLCVLASTSPALSESGGEVVSRWILGSTDWSNDSNWTNTPMQGGYPNNGEFSYVAIVRNGVATISENINVNEMSLGWDPEPMGFGNGGVTGSSTLTVIGQLDVGGASSFTGSGTLDVGSINLFSGGLTIDGWTVNADTVLLGDADSNSQIFLDGIGALNVGTELAILRDGNIVAANGASTTVTNTGAVRKIGGGGFSDINPTFMSNAGSIECESGVLRFPSAAQSGPVTITNTSLLVSNGGSMIFSRGATFVGNIDMTANGAGNIEWSSGTFQADGTMNVGGDNTGGFLISGDSILTGSFTVVSQLNAQLLLRGGSIASGGSVTSHGFLRWRSCTVQGSLTIAEGILNETEAGAGDRRIDGGTLTNNASFRQFHTITLANGGTFMNGANGNWRWGGSFIINSEGMDNEIVIDGQVSSLPGFASATIEPTCKFLGEPELELAGAVTFKEVDCSQSPPTIIADGNTVTIESGDLGLAKFKAGTNLGIVQLVGSDFSGDAISSLAGGPGRFELTGAASDLSSMTLDFDPSMPFFVKGGAALATSGDITNRGAFTWDQGVIAGVFNNNLKGNATVETSSGPAERLIKSGAAFNHNDGRFLQNGPVCVEGQLNIADGAIWDLNSTGATLKPGQSDGLVTNSGQFRALSNNSVTVPFSNEGEVRTVSGSLTFDENTVVQFDDATGTLTGGCWIATEDHPIIFESKISPLKFIGGLTKVEIRKISDMLSSLTGLRGTLDVRNGSVLDVTGNDNGGDLDIDFEFDDPAELGDGEEMPFEGVDPALIICNRLTVGNGRVTVFNDAILQANVGIDLFANSELRGDDGNIITPLLHNLAGTVRPGAPSGAGAGPADTTGVMNVDGDLVQDALGTLEIELGGTRAGAFDQLLVTGDAALDGTLLIRLAEGFEPVGKETFEILTASAVTGTFLAIDTEVPVDVVYGPTGVTVIVTGARCPLDLNGDGSIGPPDLAAVLDAWGPNPGSPADFNGDGDVGPADLAALLDGWGPCP